MRYKHSIYGFLLLATSPYAPANESEIANQDSLIQIPIEQLMTMDVQSASRISSQISVAPSAVSIVTAEDIKAYGYHTLAEILESMRGLYITNDRAYSFLGGRGYGRPGDFTGRIMLLLDGTQVNNNIYNSAGLGYTGIIDPALIECVEYVSGPGSTIYGNNAFFGIINVVTKQGHDVNGLQVSGEVSSYQGREAKIHYGKRLENGAELLLSASGFNSDGQNHYFSKADTATGDGVARNLDEQHSRRLFGKLEWDGWFAELAYTTRKKDIPTAPYGADFNAPYNYEDTMLQASLKHDRQAVDNCQMLFIDASELENSAVILKQLANTPVLTVTDHPDLFNAGVMIGLFLENKRLTFDVNYAQAQNAQLSVSSKLLRVARNVLR